MFLIGMWVCDICVKQGHKSAVTNGWFDCTELRLSLGFLLHNSVFMGQEFPCQTTFLTLSLFLFLYFQFILLVWLQRCGPAHGLDSSITLLSRKAAKKKNQDLQVTQILKCSVLRWLDNFYKTSMISAIFQNKGHPVDRAEEKLHCLAQAHFLKFFFPLLRDNSKSSWTNTWCWSRRNWNKFWSLKVFLLGGWGWWGRSRAVLAGIVLNNWCAHSWLWVLLMPQNKHFWWCITDRALLLPLNLLPISWAKMCSSTASAIHFKPCTFPSSSCLSISPGSRPPSAQQPQNMGFPGKATDLLLLLPAGHMDAGTPDPSGFVTHISGPALPKFGLPAPHRRGTCSPKQALALIKSNFLLLCLRNLKRPWFQLLQIPQTVHSEVWDSFFSLPKIS